MAEKVVTQFIVDLSQYDAQIASATESMSEYDKEATEAAKANKDLSGSVGSASTKVTQLASASKAAGKGIKDAGTATKEASKNVGGFRDAFGAAKDELNSAFPVFGKIANAATLMGRAFTAALGPVGIAIAAVVAGVGLLLKAFAGTQEGADKLAKVTAVLGAVFDRLLGVAQVLGKTIFDAFANPKQAVNDLWEAVKTNIANRLTGLVDQWKFLGEVIAGVFTLDSDRITAGVNGFGEATTRVLTGVENLTEKAGKAFSDFGDEIAKAAETGARIAEIDRNLRALALNRAQQEGRITRELEEQRAIVSDVTKSSAQRTSAAQKFNALQKELTGFETRRLDLEIERGNLAASTSDTLDEEKIRIAGLVSAKEEALARELAANREINNQINGLNKAAADKAIAEAQRVEAERQKAEEAAIAKKRELAAEQVSIQQSIDAKLDDLQQQRELSQLSATERAVEEARIRASKEVEVAAVAYDRLEELAEGNAERIAEIREQEAQSTALIEQALAEQIATIRDENAQVEAEKLKEEQQQRIDILSGASEQLNSVIEQGAAGQIATAEEAGKALMGIALDLLEKQALLAISSATVQSIASPESVATGGTLGIAKAAILTALIKAALAAVRGAISGAYEGGIVGENGVGTKFSNGRDGYISRVHKGEMIVPAAETKKYMPYLEMMRGGNFEEYIQGLRSSVSFAGGRDGAGQSFSDKRLVGALGTVGSLNEQRKQTELLASMNARMGRGINKRYRAA